jgi:hypothetical protein
MFVLAILVKLLQYCLKFKKSIKFPPLLLVITYQHVLNYQFLHLALDFLTRSINNSILPWLILSFMSIMNACSNVNLCIYMHNIYTHLQHREHFAFITFVRIYNIYNICVCLQHLNVSTIAHLCVYHASFMTRDSSLFERKVRISTFLGHTLNIPLKHLHSI